MSRLDELIKELCPNGVEFQRIKDVCDDVIVPMRDRPKTFDGNIPWCRIEDKEGQYFNKSLSGLGVSEDVIKKMNLKVFPTGTVICSCSASLGTYAINTQPLITNQTFIGLVCGKRLFNKYLLYYMETQTKYLKSQASTGTIPYISRKKFEEMLIPVPPLEVQREIVRVLDSFTLLTAELTAELTARKKQYEFYRDKLLSHDGNYLVKSLAELGEWSGGKTPSMSEKSFWEQGTIPWISSKDMKSSTLIETKDHITEKAVKEASMTVYPANSIAIVTRSGILKHTFPVAYVPFETTINQDIKMLVVNEGILPRYAFHVIQGKGNDILIKTKKQGGTVDSLDFQKVLAYKVPVPSKDIQSRVVELLDNFESICTDLNIGLPAEIEARQKQYDSVFFISHNISRSQFVSFFVYFFVTSFC